MLEKETKPRSNSPINTKYSENAQHNDHHNTRGLLDEIEYSNRTSVGSSHTD
jgi:hypothetical protein